MNDAQEFIIPKCEGKAFTVKKGQTLRIIEVEGPQAADVTMLNLHDFRESYSGWLTRQLCRSFVRAKKLYSKLPAGSVMFTVLTEIPGTYWLSSGRCSSLKYKLEYGLDAYHKNCQDILAGCLKQYGISEYDLPDVFNIFMKAVFHEDGSYSYEASNVKIGDYVDLRSEMDCLVAISACPDERGVYNDFNPKPLKVQILE